MAGEAGDLSKSLRSEPMRCGLPSSGDKHGVPPPQHPWQSGLEPSSARNTLPTRFPHPSKGITHMTSLTGEWGPTSPTPAANHMCSSG